MYQDYKDFLYAFRAHGVHYLIVGGYAVIFHAQPRFTKNLDVFLQADPRIAGQFLPGLPASALRSKGLGRKTLARRPAFTVSEVIHMALTFCPTFPAWCLKKRGADVLMLSSIRVRDLLQALFQPLTLSQPS